ncbi:hypothetical protein H6F46_17125 [Limnothrix sp. FACHB-1083]|uniref:hypothetical protein n=1 Tax=unclassified Limnothrix TaxID=2632864 RepID=UPI00167FEF33|nr:MULTISPECIES: hypothetical protein [unclassified Limnothrix]MBD2162415.1 hypothetical protein [Limnothrix sp. FACHB-1083]MBD2193430.1 hypothetical protein [Limnothrix sp. FACHB-1088]
MTPKKVPVIIGNANPFRLILREEDQWNPTLEEINSREYDYVKLHRMSTYLDVGIAPLSLGITFDGSLILPALPEFAVKDAALEEFNKALAYLLFGGIYTEAVSPEDITIGTLTLDGYSRSVQPAYGAAGRFHQSIRDKYASGLDLIQLLHPRKIFVKDLKLAFEKGKNTLSKLDSLSVNLLLIGVTYFVKHQWAEALVILWTVVEQVISHIWKSEIINVEESPDQEIQGRKRFLQDFRTWTTATKVEILYQKNLMTHMEYSLLNIARKSRNDFVHSGKVPNQECATACINVLFNLVSLVISQYQDSQSLNDIRDSVTGNLREPLVPKQERVIPKGKDHEIYWCALPPLPGDPLWGDKEYEIIEELVLEPVQINKKMKK